MAHSASASAESSWPSFVFDGLMRRLDQQARVVDVVASQAEALATGDFDPGQLLESTPSDEAAQLLLASMGAHSELLAAAKQLQNRQRDLGAWLQRVASEARVQQQEVC